MEKIKFELVRFRKNRKKPVWCIKVTNNWVNYQMIDDFFDPHNNKRIEVDGKLSFKYSSKTLAEEALLCAIIRFG